MIVDLALTLAKNTLWTPQKSHEPTTILFPPMDTSHPHPPTQSPTLSLSRYQFLSTSLFLLRVISTTASLFLQKTTEIPPTYAQQSKPMPRSHWSSIPSFYPSPPMKTSHAQLLSNAKVEVGDKWPPENLPGLQLLFEFPQSSRTTNLTNIQ
mmetsp:Transcript_13419/g.29627  ORF Transcript_13419/g.29627 Transcript_13419/m.29627 type:complete len:152 (+) Transcript_13419:380-835(+)